jgi:hypothetical protein
MMEPDDNPYAAPNAPVEAPATLRLPISPINRIVSMAFIAFATILLLGLISGVLIENFAPPSQQVRGRLSANAILVNSLVISTLYVFAFWLRRPRR